MNASREIRTALIAALKTCGIETEAVTLERPALFEHGDFSTNAALAYAKGQKANPRALAERIKAALESKLPESVQAVEIAGPGFINFRLKPEVFAAALDAARTDPAYGNSAALKAEKILLEHTQPNPFKEFHIGHLMNNTIGESLGRIYKAAGADVEQATYHGDVGMHVAKALWAVLRENIELADTKALGRAYALGATAFEENEQARKEITEINKKIYEKSDAALNELYEKGRALSFADFERLYKRLGSMFEHHFYESESAVAGKKTVEAHIADGIFEKSEGAVVFKGEKYGLHTRVFINKEGLPTYEAKDVGLVELKRRKFPFTMAVTVTANEQTEYFKVVNCAIGLIHPDLSKKIVALAHGMLKLPSGKMSSRSGSIISADSLIERVEAMVAEKIKDRNYAEKEARAIIEAVSLSAIKYSILKQGVGGDIIFDFEKSISFEGDSGPYLQYTYARAKSVLEKAKAEKVNVSVEHAQEPGILEKLLVRFPEIAERAARENAPHMIASYLTELAAAFNSFYAGTKIVDADDPFSPYKIALAESLAAVLKSGLNLLGIPAPERM